MAKAFLKILSSVFLLILLYGCGDDGTSVKNNDKTDQSALLKNVGGNLIVKGYADFSSKATAMDTSVAKFVMGPSSSALDTLRNTFEQAYISWQNVAFYNFGPAELVGLLNINIYPTDTAQVKSYIAAGQGGYNLSSASAITAKGFPAIDFLLYGVGTSDGAIVSYFENNENARNYLKDVSHDIALLSKLVYDAWSPTGQNFVSTFIANTGTSNGSSLSLMVNAWSQYMELHLRNAKIGNPNGNLSGSSQLLGPKPEIMEAYYHGGLAVGLTRTTIKAISNFYMGKSPDGNDGEGVYDYLKTINAQNGTLADDYLAQLNGTLVKLDKLDENLALSIKNQRNDVTDVFNSLKNVVALLKVDMVSALSISINYADNDGD